MDPEPVTTARPRARSCRVQPWALVVALLAGLFLGGCTGTEDADRTTIRVGLYENAPKIHSDETGTPSGLFIELLEAVARKENWQLDYVPCRWSDCLMAVQQGDIDLMPDVASSERRRQFLDYHAIPVAQSWSQLYIPINRAGITGLEELEGQRIAVLSNSIHESYLENHLEEHGLNLELLGVDTMHEAFRRVGSGEADAAVTNNFFGSRHAGAYDLVETPVAFNQTSLFYATTRGRNPWILETLDQYLMEWKSDANSPYYRSLARTITPPATTSTPGWVTPVIGLGSALILALGIAAYTLRGQALRHFRDARESRHRLHHLTHYDRRTGLPNRSLLQRSLDQLIHEADPRHDGLMVFLIDLDRFKTFNETLGIAQGDEILLTIAERLREFAGSSTSLARVGNDEFCLVVEKPATPEKRQALANRLLEAIRMPLPLPDHPLVMTASIGISHYPEHGSNAEDLIAGAELAMDAAHKAGGNTCHLYDPAMGEQSTHRLFLEHDLRRAIDNEEFVAYFQLQYHLQTGAVSGAEALVRWHQPDRGMVSPGDFIPLAEETGLITDVDFWVLKTACRQIAAWEQAGSQMPRIAVNLSTRDLQDERLCPMVREILEETGIQPQRLELEITETLLMESPQDAVDVMNRLSELGIRLSMDDFGRGYSNLAFLRQLPLDQLKIDMSLIQDIEASERNRSIVRAIVDFAKALDLELVAEGIETNEQLEFLREHGCDLGQGFFFARPLPAEQVFRADAG